MERRTFYMFMSPSLLVMLALMVFPIADLSLAQHTIHDLPQYQ